MTHLLLLVKILKWVWVDTHTSWFIADNSISVILISIVRIVSFCLLEVQWCLMGDGHVFVDKVCAYFGVKIALYFAYLGHYTAALLWPALLGTVFWLLSGTHQVNSFILVCPRLRLRVWSFFTSPHSIHVECVSVIIFTARCYASAVLAMGLCLSVTSRSSTITAKRRITQTTPHDSPETLVFWRQRSPRNSIGVTCYEGTECRWGGSKSATFDQ